jgi:hypothetical protein
MDPQTAHMPGDAEPIRPGSPRRRLLKGAGLAGAVGLAGALLQSTDAQAQSTPPLFGLEIVSPTGNTTGSPGTTNAANDTTNIQNALNTYGLVALTPGVYYVTQLTIPTGGRLIGCGWGPADPSSGPPTGTVLRAGSATPVPTQGESVTLSTYPMITVPVGSTISSASTHWVIQDIVISGQAPPNSTDSSAYFPYTSLIYVEDFSGGVTNDTGTIYRCYVELSGGHGIYIGEDRSFTMVDQCWSTNHNQNGNNTGDTGLWGTQIYGAAISINTECIISRCALASSYYGYYIGTTAAMTRIIDCDIFLNQIGGNISSGTASVERCSHDQQQQTGIVVANSATGVTIHSRFTSNGLAQTSETNYSSIDVSGAGQTGNGQPGVTLVPGTVFLTDEFGDTAQVTYDIYTGTTTSGLVQDYSTWDTKQYSIGHIGPLSS